MVTLIKKHLEFEEVYPYFIDNIFVKRILSKSIEEYINFKEGTFFTVLPDNADFKRINDYKCGGILQHIENNFGHGPKALTTFPNLTNFILNFLHLDETNKALFDNFNAEPKHPNLEINEMQMLQYKNEIYYLASNLTPRESIIKGINRTDLIWHFLLVLFQDADTLSSNLVENDFDLICSKIRFVITSAYDAEAYIFWERNILM